jgi:hypothetical protein
VFDTVLECAGRLPSPHCEIFIGRLGGVAARVAPDAMAYGNRDADFVMNVHPRWETAARPADITRSAFLNQQAPNRARIRSTRASGTRDPASP